MKNKIAGLALAFVASGATTIFAAPSSEKQTARATYDTTKIDGQNIFCREAGGKSKPTILLLHGFSTSSFMFRDLIPQLAEKYHVVAPDYVGFGRSSMPKVNEFEYTFEKLTDVVDKFAQELKLKKYSIYI